MKQIIITVLIPILGSVLISPAWTQLSQGGKPYFHGMERHFDIKYVTMPAFDIEEQIEISNQQNIMRKPLRFAYSFDVSYTPENSGEWTVLEDGSQVWNLGIISKGAYSLNFLFNKFRLNEGVRLFIHTPDMDIIKGAFDHQNNNPSGRLAIAPLAGDKIVIELFVPYYMESYGELEIGKVAHDYLNIFGKSEKDGNFGRSGECNIDINCLQGDHWQNEKNAVARIIINTSELCTGTLLNNTSEDETPYFLTANHCIDNSNDAEYSVFCFDYESPYCGGPDGSTDYTISGSKIRAKIYELDFTLVELNDKPPYSFPAYFAGWTSDTSAPQKTTTIHHPFGDVKKISLDNNPPITGDFLDYDEDAFWNILVWDAGTTEGGSSGAPLFNKDHHLVGTLTGGSANCNQPVDDYYIKFHLAWDKYPSSDQQLKHWLDSAGTGLKKVNSFVHNDSETLETKIAKNKTEVCSHEEVVYEDTSYTDAALYIWDFGAGAKPQIAYIKGPVTVTYDSPGTKTIKLKKINGQLSDSTTTEINVIGGPTSQFSIAKDDREVTFINSSTNYTSCNWNFGDGSTSTEINPVYTYGTYGEYIVFLTCESANGCEHVYFELIDVGNSGIEDIKNEDIKIYPNPSDGFIYLEFADILTDTQIEVYDALGQRVMTDISIEGDVYVIQLRNKDSGLYVINLYNERLSVFKRMPVILY